MTDSSKARTTDSSKAKTTEIHVKAENHISEVELDKVTGGQSTGAGAGKVTFNPF